MVTMNDVRAAGLCSHGAREFFARNQLDWMAFLNGGLPASVIMATQDGMAARAVAMARKRVGAE